MHYKVDPQKHAAIFGPKEAEPPHTGRSRKCKTCGGWHPLNRPWPHNCRSPNDGPRQILSAPLLAPAFEPFVTGKTDTAEVINSRNEKREYMKRHDLVEHDTGVDHRNEWVEERANEREVVETIKRFRETDTDNLSPDLKLQRMEEGGSLEEGTEINPDDIEVVK